MKVETTVALSEDLVAIEGEDAGDLDIINSCFEGLNEEAADVLEYQVIPSLGD
jgi:hypothetical protein